VPAIEIIGWSLLQSVWQGGVVALLLWGVLRVLGDGRPGLRHGAAVLALIGLLALPVVNYRETVGVWEGQRAWLVETAEGILRGRVSEGGVVDPTEVAAEVRRRHATAWPGDAGAVGILATRGREPVRALVWVWLAVGLALVARLGLQARRARALAESGRPDPRWRETCRRVGERMAVAGPVRVRITDGVDVPGLIGWRWPVVLVPASVAGVPRAEAEAILAHELAHVRRHDYLVNALQSTAEALLFYSPAAWWISARIREERECSCDAAAIPAVAGGPTEYLRALLSLETARPGRVALALNGGPLVRRIRRIHTRARGGRSVGWRATGAMAVLLSLAAAAPHGRPTLAARVGATSLVLQDLDALRVVVRTVHLPGPPIRASEPAC
jgi:hypothetical protein